MIDICIALYLLGCVITFGMVAITKEKISLCGKTVLILLSWWTIGASLNITLEKIDDYLKNKKHD